MDKAASQEFEKKTGKESPDYLQMSLAAAMTLGLKSGSFYKNATLPCVNLLLTYEEGCYARCAYCGLSYVRECESGIHKDKSFIRVEWPTHDLNTIVQRLNSKKSSHVERVCISMLTNKRALTDTITVAKRIKNETNLLISALITPTIITKDWLVALKNAGVDKIGIAIDAATPELFDKFRGKGTNGPHKWETYWQIIHEGLQVFGRKNVGIHLIVGLGETEKEMAQLFQQAADREVLVHLFSFFPEPGSPLENRPQPPIGQYRRVQLVRYLIEERISRFENMKFDDKGRLIDFGILETLLNEIINTGIPFMTSGCPGSTLQVACTRPFANSTPFQAFIGECRNFPYKPNKKEIELVLQQLSDYSDRRSVQSLNCDSIFDDN
ncbi:MAG: radical SAM protein [Promethearchaeota archaeon]